MQIVIDIPEKIYNDIKSKNEHGLIFNAVKNGTPLPKNHGDLIDRNELLNNSYEIDSIYCLYDIVVNVDDIKDAPTIIEEVNADE